MRNSQSNVIGIGLLGLGTVGTGVFKMLKTQADAIERKTGIRLELRRVCVKSLKKKRSVSVPRALLTRNAEELVHDPSIDILVELIGGIHPAKDIIEHAFRHGKHVVTANKALLAEESDFIFAQAAKHSKMLGIEASVCGGIPIIKSLEEGLAANDISRFLGIVNGTCNYILTAMSGENGPSFDAALKEATEKGYAEKNPSLDIDGVDSAHKLAILARLAFHSAIPYKEISVEGIRGLAQADIQNARKLGYSVKLLAVGKKHPSGLELRVHPTLLPLEHPLSSVRGVYNAVFVHADQAGDLLFYGKGAGMDPTASAVMSDIIDGAKKIVSERPDFSADLSALRHLRVLPIEQSVSKYYLRFQVADRPGVLGLIARTLGKHGISILSVHQTDSHKQHSVPVVILTYEAPEKNIRAALREIRAKKGLSRKTVLMRVEG